MLPMKEFLMITRHEFLRLLKVSFVIASIIFVTAVCSDFSVKMLYSSTDYRVQIFAGLLAVLFIMVLLMMLLLLAPDLRKALFRMFGMEK